MIKTCSLQKGVCYIGTKGYAIVTGGAKAAQVAFNRQLAVEWGPHGIRCNVIAPGYIATEGSAAVGPQILDMVRNQSPIKVVGDVDDMKLALSYLLKAEKMTGTTISPNCGVFSF